jgi:porin
MRHMRHSGWLKVVVAGCLVEILMFANAKRTSADDRGMAIFLTTPALTLDVPAPVDPPAETPTYGSTGDWGGARTTLADKGLSLAGYVSLDVSKNLRGGLDTQATACRYVLDLSATFNPEPLYHWQGAAFFLELQSHDGPNGTANLTGDLLGFDNTDASHFLQIYQLWYEQKFADDQLRAKVGKIDAATEFSVMPHGMDFLNSTMAYSVSMFTLPTYPDPAPGALLFWQPNEHVYVGGGLFYTNACECFLDFVGHPQKSRATTSGLFLIAEAGLRWELASQLPGTVGIGAWRHTGDFEPLNGGADIAGTNGLYVFADQTLWYNDDTGGRDVGVFLEGGLTDPAVNAISRQFGGGLTLTGLLPFRPDDVTGMGAAWAQSGDQSPLRFNHELTCEWFYKCRLASWASAKLDVQYIRHPGADLEDALVTTIRLQVDF